MSQSQRLEVPEGFPTEVFVSGSIDAALLPAGPWVLIGDENVRVHWERHNLPQPAGSLWVPTSEKTKRLATLEPWLEAWAAVPLHRNVTVLAVGGGVLTDMGGLAASLFLRGAQWHSWPTTLLSQVDAGLGGKTGVNLDAGKNLAGAFHPPARMVVCAEFLTTLSPRHIQAGAWELFKMALIEGDLDWAKALLDSECPNSVDLQRSLGLKAGVTHRDFKETGERRLLNLGHTLGHALETASNFGLMHGEAVGLGTLAACLLAEDQGIEPFPTEFLQAFARRLRPLADRIASWDACLPLLARDKKATSQTSGLPAIHCVIPVPGQRATQRLLPPDAWASAHARLQALLS